MQVTTANCLAGSVERWRTPCPATYSELCASAASIGISESLMVLNPSGTTTRDD